MTSLYAFNLVCLLLSLLIAATVVALELIITAQRLGVAEASQTVRNRGVLVHVHLQVEEVLILAAHRLAVQATRLTGQDTLERTAGHVFSRTSTFISSCVPGIFRGRTLVPPVPRSS